MHPSAKTFRLAAIPILLAGAIQALPVLSAPSCDPATSPHADWPQFRGRTRDGLVTETGLLPSWPEGGPTRMWTAQGLGKGWSSPIVVEDTLYITGDIDKRCRIFALHLDGSPKWAVDNGKAWTSSYPGARASCTYDRGDLFHLNAHGRVVCLDPENGQERWAVNILERFQASNIKWGISECLVVDETSVYVTPGGPQAMMAALDRHTGETRWESPPLRFLREHAFGGKAVDPPQPDTDKAGYVSPLLVTFGEQRLLFSGSARHLFCVDADHGNMLWQTPVYAQYEVIGSMPAVWKDTVFFSAPDDFGGTFYRITQTDQGLRLEEEGRVPLDICHGSAVIVGDRLYGSGHRRHRAWTCIDLNTHEMQYTTDEFRQGASIFADGRLYALAQNGVLVLMEPTDQGFQIRGEIALTNGRSKDAWSHPVILNGRLYLRYHEQLECYDIRRAD